MKAEGKWKKIGKHQNSHATRGIWKQNQCQSINVTKISKWIMDNRRRENGSPATSGQDSQAGGK